jgi:uncharacterized protein (DUF1499 family)
MMTTMATPASRATVRRPRRLPIFAVLLAGTAALLLALAPLGWRAGWWHYSFAFRALLPGAAYCAIAAAGLAALALWSAGRAGDRRGILIGLLALVIGAAVAYVPWQFDRLRRALPPIDDITTDWVDPPAFAAVVAQRQAEDGNPTAYGGAPTAEEQRRAYPDIAPAILDLPPAQAFAQALDAATRLGWTIVAADAETGHIEASERSRWFGFTDDIAVRVAAAGSGSRIDIRSSSRHGRSDFGVNAERIRRFLAALRSR